MECPKKSSTCHCRLIWHAVKNIYVKSSNSKIRQCCDGWIFLPICGFERGLKDKYNNQRKHKDGRQQTSTFSAKNFPNSEQTIHVYNPRPGLPTTGNLPTDQTTFGELPQNCGAAGCILIIVARPRNMTPLCNLSRPPVHEGCRVH